MRDYIGLILQALSLQILFQDFNNADLMKEIKRLLEQNQRILELLEGRKDDRES